VKRIGYRLGCLAAVMVLGSSAEASSFSFTYHGRRVRVERPRHCFSMSCVSVTLPGGHGTRQGHERVDDVAAASDAAAARPAASSSPPSPGPAAPLSFAPAPIQPKPDPAPPPRPEPLKPVPAESKPSNAEKPVDKPAAGKPVRSAASSAPAMTGAGS
jgi:hypothetical protein